MIYMIQMIKRKNKSQHRGRSFQQQHIRGKVGGALVCAQTRKLRHVSGKNTAQFQQEKYNVKRVN